MIVTLVMGSCFLNANVYSQVLSGTPLFSHWATGYADNLENRLEQIKQMYQKQNHMDNDMMINQINQLTQNLLDKRFFDDFITMKDWHALLYVFLEVEKQNIPFSASLSHKRSIAREDTIAEMMTILADKQYISIEDVRGTALAEIFQDSEQIDDNKAIWIVKALKEEIISGYGDATLRPKHYLRIAEAITMIEKICAQYALPQKQWVGDIYLLNREGDIYIKGPTRIEEAMWTQDNSILVVYDSPTYHQREAAKIFLDKNEVVKAIEYGLDNISERLFNANAFKKEKGYLSANKILWDKQHRYINAKGEIKQLYIPHIHYSICPNQQKVLLQDEQLKRARIFDFLSERSVTVYGYYRWADANYHRSAIWSPNGKHLVSELFEPQDDIGIGEKKRFAIFESNSGKLIRIIHDRKYYSFYPTWSPDGKKLAFFRVAIDDKQLSVYLNNMLNRQFNLPAREVGIYDVQSDTIQYYQLDDKIILGKYTNGIIWDLSGEVLYVEAAVDNTNFLNKIDKGNEVGLTDTPNEVWKIDLENKKCEKVLTGKWITEKEELSLEQILPMLDYFLSPLEQEMAQQMELEEIFDLSALQEMRVKETNYAVIKRVLDIGKQQEHMLYMRQKYNLDWYENIPAQFIVLNQATGEHIEINRHPIINHWWLDDGRLLFVEGEVSYGRNRSITYHIKILDTDFNLHAVDSFSQALTSISLSPNGKYLMIYRHRGDKEVRVIKIA